MKALDASIFLAVAEGVFANERLKHGATRVYAWKYLGGCRRSFRERAIETAPRALPSLTAREVAEGVFANERLKPSLLCNKALASFVAEGVFANERLKRLMHCYC